MTNEKEKQYREEFDQHWASVLLEIRKASDCGAFPGSRKGYKRGYMDGYLAACKKREEEIRCQLACSAKEIGRLKKQLEETEKELYQQRFNNKHNLSIDQKVSDEIASLKKQLEETRNILAEIMADEEIDLKEEFVHSIARVLK